MAIYFWNGKEYTEDVVRLPDPTGKYGYIVVPREDFRNILTEEEIVNNETMIFEPQS